MNSPKVEKTLAQLLGSTQPEIGCDDCFDQLDQYVELEVAGSDPDTTLPGLSAHLSGCSACREEHESLLAFIGSNPGS